MMSLVNLVPTSGQVRETRRRIRRHLPPALERVVHKPDMLAEPGHEDAEHTADPGTLGQPPASDRRVNDADVPEVIVRLIAAVSAGLDVVERVSDEAHDTVEENLARVSGLPRTIWPSWPAPRDHNDD